MKKLIIPVFLLAIYAGFQMANAHTQGGRTYSFSPGVAATVEADGVDTDAIVDEAVTLAKMADGVALGDMLRWSGSAWQYFDANEPNNVLTLNDSNEPEWRTSVPLDPGSSIGGKPGGGKARVKFEETELFFLDSDVGIGTEEIDAGTKFTIQEDTANADLRFEFQADANSDDADRWRFLIDDGDGFALQSFATGAWVTVQGWVSNSPEVMAFNMVDPPSLQALDSEFCLKPIIPYAYTVTRVVITLDADPTTELDADLYYADAFIGQANAQIISVIDTTNGTADIGSMTGDATVPADKTLYIVFGGAPDAATLQAAIMIEFTID